MFSFAQIHNNIAQSYIGNQTTVFMLVVAMLSGGHVLLEGVPGLAKTTLAKALAQTFAADFHRVQFTMDLMPGDITGSNIFKLNDSAFTFIPGPIFTNILLADEINRAPARTQSALLEAMQENQVTVDGKTYPLPSPFFVIATQNEIDERGTWPLPESELDRFMFRIRLEYPSAHQEQLIIKLSSFPEPQIKPIVSLKEIHDLSLQIQQIRVSDEICSYIASLIRQTRLENDIIRGASPRAGALMLKAARSCAFLHNSEFVTPDHVREIAPFILNHRLVLDNDAQNIDSIISRILNKVPFK